MAKSAMQSSEPMIELGKFLVDEDGNVFIGRIERAEGQEDRIHIQQRLGHVAYVDRADFLAAWRVWLHQEPKAVSPRARSGITVIAQPSYFEINKHTGERRVHTKSSLLARLKATGILALLKRRGVEIAEGQLPPLPIEGKHADFRRATDRDDLASIPAALDSGAWGRIAEIKPELPQTLAA